MSNLIDAQQRSLEPVTSSLESLPSMLLSLLERRYLSDFEAGDWTFSLGNDPAQVLLHELTAMGKQPRDKLPSMAQTLSAWHEPGQSVIAVVQGHPDANYGHRQRVFYGARRTPGGRSTEDFLESQACSFSSQFSGHKLGPALPLHEHTSLVDFLRSAPALGVITGIPSLVSGAQLFGMERLVRTIGSRDYAMMIVAEPVSYAVSDLTLDVCRRLQTDISTYLSRQITTSSGGAKSTDMAPVMMGQGGGGPIPGYLRQCACFIATVPGQQMWSGVMGLAAMIVAELDQKPVEGPMERTTKSENWSESTSHSQLDSVARTCDELLARHSARIQTGRGWGWWKVAIYLAADSEATLQTASRAVRATSTGDTTGLDPLRLVRIPTAVLRDAMLHGRVVDVYPQTGDATHPLGHDYNSLATCMSSHELAAVAVPPLEEVTGIPLQNWGEFAATIPPSKEPAFELGRTRDSSGADRGSASISARILNEHLLIVGTPGSGKTNTCMHLLLSAEKQFNVPFLVVEPAKAEYRQLQKQLGANLKVYSIGGGASPLRLNPLSPVAGAPLLGHIDLLKAVFNASFAMLPGMPQILEQALLEVYQDRGWDLQTGKNIDLKANDDLTSSTLIPCLADLHDQVEAVMQRKGYAGEVRMNMGAAVRSRLQGLMFGAKGNSLNVRRGVSDHELFNSPVVLELQYLRDDDEKAFVMATVFMRLYQYCEVRQRRLPPHRREQLQHITLIEEAHRLLASVGADREGGNPRSKAVGMFNDMLAELRALGEGFMIAEQIPSKLSSDALKNTNLKIVHRLTDYAERRIAGQCASLNDSQVDHLSNLSKGLAVVHGLAPSDHDAVAAPALVQVVRVKSPESAATLEQLPMLESPELERRHGGCRDCDAPCQFHQRVETELAESHLADWLPKFIEAVILRDSARAWKLWSRWRLQRSYDHPSQGADYCWFVSAIREWLGKAVLLRASVLVGASRLRPSDRLLIEQLNGDFGALAKVWLAESSLTSAAEQALAALRSSLLLHLTSEQKPARSACDLCPSACQMIPLAVSNLTSKTTSLLAPLFVPSPPTAFGQQPMMDARWPKLLGILKSVEPEVTLPADMDIASWKRAWRFCLLSNVELPSEAAVHRESLLAALLKT